MMWKLIDGQFYEEDAEWSETGEDELWAKEDIVTLLNRYEEMIDEKKEMIDTLLDCIESTERSREYWINQYGELIQALEDRDIELDGD